MKSSPSKDSAKKKAKRRTTLPSVSVSKTRASSGMDAMQAIARYLRVSGVAFVAKPPK
jgi:hypothetical protein